MDTHRMIIAYDKASSFSRIRHDLHRAGFSNRAEALVLSVADVFVPVSDNFTEVPVPMSTMAYYKAAKLQIEQELAKAQAAAEDVAKRLKAVFPGWKITAESVADSPAWAVIKRAESWKADLVVVGSHGWTATGQILVGSVAQKVLAEAPCSVRILHATAEEEDSPVRLVIGMDGSRDSELALEAVASRKWKKGSAAHLITVTDPHLKSAVIASGAIAEKWAEKGDKIPQAWVDRMMSAAVKKLKSSGLIVTSLVREGKPKQILVEEARAWGADAIFVGARGLRGIERFLIGSVSSAVAAHAHCSVEVVRPRKPAF